MTDQNPTQSHGTDPASNLRVPAGKMSAWGVDTLPDPPEDRFEFRRVMGPGLLMVGLAIGGGEWLTGPALTAQFGGILMWIATMSILFQCCYNLEVMRYALYCGEPMFTGFFRLAPGPRFWTCVYLLVDFGAIWPYLSANAAVPLLAAFLGHLPGTLPTTYLPQEQIVEETGLSAGLVEEMSQFRGRFGLVQDVERETGLPVDVIREMEKNPERYGNTGRWRPLPHPLTEWVDGESITEVAARTGLGREVLEKVQGRPDLFGPVEEVIRETGLPAEIVHEMARNPSAYGVTDRWKPFPRAGKREMDRTGAKHSAPARLRHLPLGLHPADLWRQGLQHGGKDHGRQDGPGPGVSPVPGGLLRRMESLGRYLLPGSSSSARCPRWAVIR